MVAAPLRRDHTTVVILNVESGEELGRIPGVANPVYGLAWSPDGQRLAFLGKPADDSDAVPQLYVMSLHGGEAERIADFPLGAFDMRWTPGANDLIVGAWLFRDALSIEATREEEDRRKDKPVRVHRTEERFFRFWDPRSSSSSSSTSIELCSWPFGVAEGALSASSKSKSYCELESLYSA